MRRRFVVGEVIDCDGPLERDRRGALDLFGSRLAGYVECAVADRVERHRRFERIVGVPGEVVTGVGRVEGGRVAVGEGIGLGLQPCPTAAPTRTSAEAA